jgi:UDP-N-acetylmuramate--alanine ligase
MSVLRRARHIHFVGIGGMGMSAIATVLLQLGRTVSGSDTAPSDVTRGLQDEGARVFQGHSASHISGCNVVVVSAAISPHNVEITAAREQGVPVIPRAAMLAELMRCKQGIAVAGTHGKTTTTSLIATVLETGGLDPTVLIGARLNSLGSNAKLGQGDHVVAEADESDGSFLLLPSVMNVVTTLDLEHLDYYDSLEDIGRYFKQFMNNLPDYGLNVVCNDDKNLRKLMNNHKTKVRVVTYGLNNSADYTAHNIYNAALQTSFDVMRRDEPIGRFALNLPGRHNVSNALAAVIIGCELGLSTTVISSALESFGGVQRRFETRGEQSGVTVVDDYGHHPEEIRHTLRTAKTVWPDKRLVVVFQPHRYTRTHLLRREFSMAFSDADALVMLDIYSAGEEPIPGVTSGILYEGVTARGQKDVYYFNDTSQAVRFLNGYTRKHDVLLTLGAGDVWKVAEQFLETGKA